MTLLPRARYLRCLGLILVFLPLLGLEMTGLSSSGLGLQIAPPMVDLTVDPGTEKSFDIVLENTGDSKNVALRVYLSPLVQDESGGYKLKSEPDPKSAVPWLQLGEDKLNLGPRSDGQITIKVKLPRDAVGSRVAAAVFEVVPDARTAPAANFGGSTTFIHRLTSIIKITARNRANRKEASIRGINLVTAAADKTYLAYGKNTMALVCAVANEGNVFLNVQGRLVIRNEAGRRIKDVPLGAGKGVILPGAVVNLVSIFPEGLPAGQYSAEISIYYDGPRPLLGKLPFRLSAQAAAVDQARITQSIRIMAAPEQFVTQLPAGAFRSFTLTLANREEYPVKVNVALRGLSSTQDGELNPVAAAEAGSFSAAAWLTVEDSNFQLGPGEKRNFRLTVGVPKETADGTRYAALVLEAERAGSSEKGLVTSIMTPVVISVGKNLIKKAELRNPNMIKIKDTNAWMIGGTLVNLGNTHLKVSGRIIVRRRDVAPKTAGSSEYIGQGAYEEVGVVEIGELQGWMLPGAARPVTGIFDKTLEAGEYQFEIQVDIGEKLPVKATLTLLAKPKK